MKKILYIAPQWLGDAIMAEPVLRVLAQHHNVDVYTPAHLADIYRDMPVHHIHAHTIARGFSLKTCQSIWQQAQLLKSKQYDAAYIMPNSFKSALIPFLANIPHRIGYNKEGRGILLHHSRPFPANIRSMRMVDFYWHILAMAPDILPPDTMHGCDFNAALPLDHYPQLPRKQNQGQGQIHIKPPYLCIAPGAEFGPAKRWSAHYFAEYIVKTRQHPILKNYSMVILGTKKDHAIAQSILANVHQHIDAHHSSSPIHDLTGHTTLAELVDILAHASHALVHDSGAMHIASSLNIPLLALYGASDALHTPPLGTQAQILFKDNLDCRPCFARVCPLGHHHCMQLLTPNEVFARVCASIFI